MFRCIVCVQLEDDVTTVPGYINAVFDFVDEQTEVGVCHVTIYYLAHCPDQPWVMLEYSLLGFIGKLFHDESLPRLAWLFRVCCL
jgi:hypothetical protein